MAYDVPEDYPGLIRISKFRKQAPIKQADIKELNTSANFIRSRAGSTLVSYAFEVPFQTTSASFIQIPTNAATSLTRIFGAGRFFKQNSGEYMGCLLAVYGRNIEVRLSLDRVDGISTVTPNVLRVIAPNATADSKWVESSEVFTNEQDALEGGVAYAESAMFIARVEARRITAGTGYLFAVMATELINTASDIANGT